MLTAERLRELVSYDPETGVFTWAITRRKVRAGTVAGSINKDVGYRYIRVDGALYLAHRLAMLYSEGVWPSCFVDHINGDKLDNRLCNLRHATYGVNSQNQRRARSDSKSGVLGVWFHEGRNRYVADIQHDGKRKRLGYFRSMDDASAAYVAAKRILHPGCTL
jgi:hypothetical protein